MDSQYISLRKRFIAYLLVCSLFFISLGIIYLFAIFSKDFILSGTRDLQIALYGKETTAYVQDVFSCHKNTCTTRVSFADNLQATLQTDRIEKGDRVRIVYDEENPGYALMNTRTRRYVSPAFSIFYGSIMVLFFLYTIFQMMQVKRGKKNEVEFAKEHPFVGMVIFVPFVFVRKIKHLLAK